MALYQTRTIAFMRTNELMTVVMTTLAVGPKGELLRSLDNWWQRMSDSKQMEELVLRVQCIKGLMTKGMKLWMLESIRGWWSNLRVITNETAMVTRAIILGWQTRKLKTVGMWQMHKMEECSIRSWWVQVQGNSTETQRRLRPWLLDMLKSWWSMLAETHEQGSKQADKCKGCGSGWFSGKADLCSGGSCRRCCRVGGYRCCCYVDDYFY